MRGEGRGWRPDVALSLPLWRRFIFQGATNIPKTNRSRLVFFRPFPPVLARIPGMASRASPLRTLHFHPWPRLSVFRFLWWSRERARGQVRYRHGCVTFTPLRRAHCVPRHRAGPSKPPHDHAIRSIGPRDHAHRRPSRRPDGPDHPAVAGLAPALTLGNTSKFHWQSEGLYG